MPGSENNKMTIPVKVNEVWCKGCKICVEFCPRSVFEMKENKAVVVRPENCVLCGLCQLRCPDFAIELEGRDEE